MESQESKLPAGQAAEPEATEPDAKTVTVTAKEDCNLYVGGQSVALAKGDTAEVTPEEALQYANLGLVEVSRDSREASAGIPKGRR